MTLNQIKFSHIYPKLHGQTKAELLDIKTLDAKDVQANKGLLEYDTRYSDEELPGLNKYYSLPKSGELIQLIFLGDKGIPFCTIRPRWRYDRGENRKVDKVGYYVGKIGEMFDIVIKKENESG